MDLKFIDRVIKTTLVLAAALFPFFAIYIKMNFALSVLFGAVWGALNLLGIKIIIISLLVPEKPNWVVGLIILFLKLPVLYFLGYLLATWSYMSIGGLLWGFSGILIVSVLKVLSRTYLGLDKKDTADSHPSPAENKA
ncbi:MAG: hypothetical protein A2W25_00280 [candidate division Zixibacteria bacterium RBG_16_53_22]|nr:MAG: hypothetical protein A2W25_00280 [candidate division Zixibacteria bacterium RBG_16_53_22]